MQSQNLSLPSLQVPNPAFNRTRIGSRSFTGRSRARWLTLR